MKYTTALREFLAEFGSFVRDERKRLGISQEELAERSGLHRTYITDVERGVRNMTFESTLKLMRALDIPFHRIFPRSRTRIDDRPSDAIAEILLVEDNARDRELTIGALQRYSLVNHIATAGTGHEALSILGIEGEARRAGGSQRLPNLALLDLRLPDIDGTEVLRRIRSHERTRRLPVVILTASRSDIDYRESTRMGISGYLTKPVDWLEFSMMMPKFGFRWMLLGRSLETGQNSRDIS